MKQHLQIPGLRETSIYLHQLMAAEISVIGSKNVVLMGLSQGCAASLISTMLWTGDAIGAVVGICGYLPLRKSMAESVHEDTDHGGMSSPQSDSDEDIFARDPSELKLPDSKLERAILWLQDELQIEVEEKEKTEQPAMKEIPVFMGHGISDEKVPLEFNRLASDFLASLDVKVARKEYQGLGHWYSEDMLRDVIEFLKHLDGWDGIINEHLD
jgi:predicted esterase